MRLFDKWDEAGPIKRAILDAAIYVRAALALAALFAFLGLWGLTDFLIAEWLEARGWYPEVAFYGGIAGGAILLWVGWLALEKIRDARDLRRWQKDHKDLGGI